MGVRAGGSGGRGERGLGRDSPWGGAGERRQGHKPGRGPEAGRLTAYPRQRPSGLDLRRARDSCGSRTAYGLSAPASARARSPPCPRFLRRQDGLRLIRASVRAGSISAAPMLLATTVAAIAAIADIAIIASTAVPSKGHKHDGLRLVRAGVRVGSISAAPAVLATVPVVAAAAEDLDLEPADVGEKR